MSDVLTDHVTTLKCDECGDTAAFAKVLIEGGPFTMLQGIDGAGSDHLAIWCGACGPTHRRGTCECGNRTEPGETECSHCQWANAQAPHEYRTTRLGGQTWCVTCNSPYCNLI